MEKEVFRLDPLEGEIPYPGEEEISKWLRALVRGEISISFAPGRSVIKPSDPLVVGQTYDFEFIYYPEEVELKEGCEIKFSIPRTWTQPKFKEGEPGYVKAITSSGAKTEIYLTQNENLTWWVNVRIVEGLVPPDGFVKIEYRNVTIQRFPQKEWINWRNSLRVILDFKGERNYREFKVVKSEKQIKPVIISSPPARFLVACHPVVKPGEKLLLRFSTLDIYNNPAYPPPEGRIFVAEVTDPYKPIAMKYLKREENGRGRIELKAPEEEKIWRISLSNIKTTLIGFAPPIVVTSRKERFNVYFGDTHAKTGLTDGLGTPEEYFTYARDHALLDFAAIADHNCTEASYIEGPFYTELPDEAFEKIKEACEKFNEPGRFVTLHGFEQNLIEGYPGHRNIYFRGIPDKIFRGRTLEELYAYLEGKEALVIPHHTVIWGSRPHLDNPKYERVLEIYSQHCSSEIKGSPINNPQTLKNKAETGMSAQEILAKGYRVGFIASSDNHHGAPGVHAYPSRFTNLTYHGGLAAVIAPELTREAIFDALYERRCYATTGVRIYLDFRINGELMGSELKVEKGEKIILEVFALGTSPIAKVEVLKNNRVISVFPNGVSDQIEFTLEDKVNQNSFYYIRLTQVDRNMAWSSPIWVDIK
ncbi:DUF3604 domain-containing protein [Candidatus Calescamantes bacterium]|nr:DUF3604 domain-containing protein [Candidatus Calescamantes bacterium]